MQVSGCLLGSSAGMCVLPLAVPPVAAVPPTTISAPALPRLQEELGKAAAARDQLQAQLDASERRAAVLAAGQGPSLPELEGMLRRLSSQRDAAQVAAAEAQARLEQREAEVAALQQRVEQLEQAGVHGEASGRFSWPTGLSSGESLADAAAPPAAAGEVAALQEALAAERQQNAQLHAALHALTADMQRLQDEQQERQLLALVPAAGSGALADVTNVPQQQQAHGRQQREVQRLAKQLARAQARIRQLAAENERLMEMSSSLRAERNRLAGAAQQGGAAGAGVAGKLLPAPLPQPPVPVPACGLPAGLWPLLAQPALGPLLPIQLAAVSGGELVPVGGGGSPAMQQQPQPLPREAQQPQQQQPQRSTSRELDVADEASRQQMAVVGQPPLRQAAPALVAAAAVVTRRPAAGGGGAGKQQQTAAAAATAGRQGSSPSPPRVRNWNVKSP